MRGKGEESKENHLTLYITDVFISLGPKHVLVKASNSSSMVVSAWFQSLSPAKLAPRVWASKRFSHRTQDRTAESWGWAWIHPAHCCLLGGMRVWVYPSWRSQWTLNTVPCDVDPKGNMLKYYPTVIFPAKQNWEIKRHITFTWEY